MKAIQITRRAKVQNETYLASLKFSGYLKLSAPSMVETMVHVLLIMLKEQLYVTISIILQCTQYKTILLLYL